MKHTGVKATPEETAECAKLVREAQMIPAILVTGMDVSANAWDRCKRRCHEMALSHGLPEIEGFYGMTDEGEFVAP